MGCYSAAVNIAYLLFPDFSLIAIGYLLCRFTPLNRPIWQGVEALVYFVFFPVLLFQSTLKSPLAVGAAWNLALAGWTLGIGGILMAYALVYFPPWRHRVDRHAQAGSAQVAFRFNSFIGLALAERMDGPSGVAAMALLFGISVPLMNMGAVWPMAKKGSRGFWRELARNPLIIGTGSGLLANLAGWQLPIGLEPIAQRIGSAALPLGLMAAGAGLQIGALRRNRRLSVGVLGIRHLAMPLLAWGIATAFSMDPLHRSILLAFSALPTASSCYVLAARMGYDGPYVAALVTASTLLGLLSLPLALLVLC
ncbi:MAG: AEC family transporter [Rhodoferax sp.]